MSNSDVPAGTTGGPVTPSALDDLPDRLRVHALAKLLGRTSREVLATLAELGVPARSVQSSVDRKAAEQVAAALVPELRPPGEDADTGPADRPAAKPVVAEPVVAQPVVTGPVVTGPVGTEPVVREPAGAAAPGGVPPPAEGPPPPPGPPPGRPVGPPPPAGGPPPPPKTQNKKSPKEEEKI